MVERKEGAGKGGGVPPTTMSVETSVNFRHFLSLLLLNKSLSILAILLLGPCHKLKKTVKGSSNNSFSYTVKLWNFIFGWKTQFTLPVRPMNLSWLMASNQHTVVTCLKNQFVFFPECYNTKPTFLFLITSWLTRPMYNKNTQWFIKRTFRSFMSLPTYYLCIHDNNFVSNKVNRCQPIYKNIERPVFSCCISILAKWLHEL